MGCSIEIDAEVFSGEVWQEVEIPLNLTNFKNYCAFGILGNSIYKRDFPAISSPKGMPVDSPNYDRVIREEAEEKQCQGYVYLFDRSWLTLKELQIYDWNRKNEQGHSAGDCAGILIELMEWMASFDVAPFHIRIIYAFGN